MCMLFLWQSLLGVGGCFLMLFSIELLAMRHNSTIFKHKSNLWVRCFLRLQEVLLSVRADESLEIGRSRGDSEAVLHEFTRACDPVCKQRFHNNSLYFILADKEKHKTKISRQIQRIQNRKSIVGKPISRVGKCKIIVGLQTKKW